MANDIAATQLFLCSSMDEFSPMHDFSTNGIPGTTMQNNHVIYPDDRDMYRRHKGMVSFDPRE